MEKIITIEEAIKLDFYNEYHQKRVIQIKEQYDIINDVHQCDCEVHVSEREDGSVYFDHHNFYLVNDTCQIQIRHDSYSKKYTFFYSEDFKNLSVYQKSDIRDKFKAPRGVGKLTKKKIADWIKYETDIYKACKEKDKNLNNDVSEFLESIKDEDVRFFGKDEKRNHYSGEIIKNGIKFTFKIENGYVQKAILIDYTVSATLDNFKLLSNNKIQ